MLQCFFLSFFLSFASFLFFDLESLSICKCTVTVRKRGRGREGGSAEEDEALSLCPCIMRHGVAESMEGKKTERERERLKDKGT